MVKNRIAAIAVLAILLCSADSVSQTCIERVYTSQIGVREATGHNDGIQVEIYLQGAGLKKGNAWCAAFVKWCFNQCGVFPCITAWSPTCHNQSRVVMKAGKYQVEPVAGDVFTIWNVKLRRISHTGFFHRKVNETFYETVEGNTNDGGSREGDGVYKRKRSIHSTYSISRWL